MLPFLFRLTRALSSGLQHGLLNGFHYGVRILAGGQDQCQFVPKPLAGSGKIEVVALDGETIGERNTSPGRMPRISPVAGFQQYGMKHTELDYFPGYPVNLHPITQANPISSHQNEPTHKAYDEIFQRHRKTCAGKSQESPQLARRTENHQEDQTQRHDLQPAAYYRVESVGLTAVELYFVEQPFKPTIEETSDQQDRHN